MPSTLLGLSAPLAAVVVHILIYRLWPQAKSFPRQKLAVLVIALTSGLIALAAWLLSLPIEQVGHATCLALMLGYSYFHFFNMSETARRIRILVEYVAHLPSRQGPYDANKIYLNRIQRMREHNMIVEQNGKLMVKPSPMLWASYLILGWRKLFY